MWARMQYDRWNQEVQKISKANEKNAEKVEEDDSKCDDGTENKKDDSTEKRGKCSRKTL